MGDIVKNTLTASLSLCLKSDRIHRFFSLLQHGVMVRTRVGCSIRMLLCNEFGLSPEYVEDRIKTVFLDGKPVDDVDSAIIKDRSTLALSAAMPGLVGATLRRGGELASLRSEITYREEKKTLSRRDGMVILKLFNLLLNELGPTFLKEGVLVRGEDLKSLLMSLPEEFWTGCKGAKVDGQEVDPGYLLGMKWLGRYELVMLRVDSH